MDPRLSAAPDKLIAIDWSGRMDVAGQRRHIYAGIWKNGRVTLENGRTREEVTAWLLETATPSTVISVDCCFSFPVWFLEEHGCATVFEFWEKANAGLAEQWLHRDCTDRRFWGKPHKRPAVFCGEGLRSMYRFTDYDNKIAQALAGGDAERAAKMRGITPKSPFQIGGSGSVGTGSLRAMPMLAALHEGGFRIWPFEDAALGKKPLLLEMYTRLMTGPVAKSNAEARRAYLKRHPLSVKLPRATMQQALASEDAFDALISVLEMARHREEFAGLRATEDAVLRLEGVTWRPGI